MLGLKNFVWVQIFRQRPFAPSHNKCHPGNAWKKKFFIHWCLPFGTGGEWTFKHGFLSMKFRKSRNMIFRKWGGVGGKGRLDPSENSSVSEAPPAPLYWMNIIDNHKTFSVLFKLFPLCHALTFTKAACLHIGKSLSFGWDSSLLGWHICIQPHQTTSTFC